MTASSAGSIAAVPLAKVLLQPRSLFVISDSIYTSHLHGITAQATDTGDVVNAELARVDKTWEAERGVRTSLTFRRANKVIKGTFSLGPNGIRRS